jgi:hypothetical protein
MQPIGTGIVVFLCTFGGALAGVWLRSRLPEHHLDDDSRDTVKVGVGLIATMTALILGLVTASAKSSFDALDTAVKHTAAELLSLDRALARYGAETAALRGALKLAIADRIELIWSPDPARRALGPSSTDAREVELLATQLRQLKPQTDDQRWLLSRAAEVGEALLEARWFMFAGIGSSIPRPFLGILLFWLTITFTSFGLFAPRNATVYSVLFVCALSVAGAVFLVLELDGPFDGLVTVSQDPMSFALERLNQ